MTPKSPFSLSAVSLLLLGTLQVSSVFGVFVTIIQQPPFSVDISQPQLPNEVLWELFRCDWLLSNLLWDETCAALELFAPCDFRGFQYSFEFLLHEVASSFQRGGGGTAEGRGEEWVYLAHCTEAVYLSLQFTHHFRNPLALAERLHLIPMIQMFMGSSFFAEARRRGAAFFTFLGIDLGRFDFPLASSLLAGPEWTVLSIQGTHPQWLDGRFRLPPKLPPGPSTDRDEGMSVELGREETETECSSRLDSVGSFSFSTERLSSWQSSDVREICSAPFGKERVGICSRGAVRDIRAEGWAHMQGSKSGVRQRFSMGAQSHMGAILKGSFACGDFVLPVPSRFGDVFGPRLVHGCIPVILSDSVTLPFGSDLRGSVSTSEGGGLGMGSRQSMCTCSGGGIDWDRVAVFVRSSGRYSTGVPRSSTTPSLPSSGAVHLPALRGLWQLPEKERVQNSERTSYGPAARGTSCRLGVAGGRLSWSGNLNGRSGGRRGGDDHTGRAVSSGNDRDGGSHRGRRSDGNGSSGNRDRDGGAWCRKGGLQG
uniref:Uncharacterized protein n=1 Tax=Chromera velia CCMP2878 TaxID=1169474 RepID=A0A0G4HRT3_9ALVE|eukprot:Cvel_30704.t1-p1 / transcript=Cvel_30704.t1 / gene=Cvel_30704 / organism=Chromera_velia_CCMP2878 / gene_product=hypothetical protein / transcript_product=hypothetical protein / location=Cvel_scaffold4430:5-8218(-) / protein_length=538 / sequence_SO=supercontig / SO=protein_coding / is_pseudo=false